MKRFFLAAIAVLAFATSCSLDTDQVMLGAEYLMAPQSGGSYQTTVYASGSWAATINAPAELKMSVSPDYGTGQTDITITVEPFDGSVDYTLGYVVFECGKAKTSFPVYQLSDAFRETLEETQNNGSVQ